jgi:hypothetical protein
LAVSEQKNFSKITMSPESLKPSPSQKAAQSLASNLLTPSELESLKKAALSSRESTKKLFPQIKFV